ncbi:MAG: polysaccharide deacetylase family protein [Candidatus Pollutiaquabacter aromativorans]|jgi:peptidoglycan/xylan/chitin deacetylase (PgdA/CDA1 family)
MPDRNKKYCLLTNDVETHSIWFNTLRDETGEKVRDEGMPILLDIYKKFGVKSTFYFVGDMAVKFPEVVRAILADGHEVASHGWTHEVDEAFDVLPYAKQVEHLQRSRKVLEDISGQAVVSFRAPALRVNEHTPRALAEAGYRTDSSVASQRFDMFLSFGGMKKLNWLKAPRLPYRTDPDNLFRKGNGPIVEVPLTALLFPFVGTTLRLFPGVTSLQQRLLHAETRSNGKPMVFDVHPNEFIEEHTEHRTIARRTNNPVKYLLNDVVRGKMKVKNLGRKAIPLYEQFIRFYQSRGYEFITVREYAKRQGFLND